MMEICEAEFGFRPESVTDAFMALWGERGCFAFLATVKQSDGYWHDAGWAVFKSTEILQVKHGHPNDEAYPGHPLYRHGLDQYEIIEVKASPWVDEIIAVNAVQFPKSSEYDWKLHHHIFPLKEVTLEVLWSEFEYELKQEPFEKVQKEMLNWLYDG